jgi:hypothetical protein
MQKRNVGKVWLVSLVALGLGGACGSSEGRSVTPVGCINPEGPGCRIDIDDGSFVRWTGPVTDAVAGGVSSAVVERTPGKMCMSGVVDSGPRDDGWGAILLFGLSRRDAPTWPEPLDLPALGITQVRFTVDSPPLSGLLPQMSQLQAADCRQVPGCLSTFGLSTALVDAGSVTVPLTDFVQPNGATVSPAALDTALVTGIQFYVASLPGMAVPYDFCVHDFALLDASGRELRP